MAIGLCEVEDGVLRPLTEVEFAEACVGNLVGLANPIGMVSIPGAGAAGNSASETLQRLAREFEEEFAGKPGVEQVLRELQIVGNRSLGAEWQMRYALEKLNPNEVVGFELAGTIDRVDIIVQRGSRITFIETKHIALEGLEFVAGYHAEQIVEQILGHSHGQKSFSKVVIRAIGELPDWFVPVLEDAGIIVEVFSR